MVYHVQRFTFVLTKQCKIFSVFKRFNLLVLQHKRTKLLQALACSFAKSKQR